jgi:tetratricopeptide (TPR) repeat protein
MQTTDFDKLWDYNKPEATEKKFREVLANTKRDENVEYYLQLLTQIARTQGLQMKFEEAHKTLDEVEKELKPEMVIPRIRYNLERGRVMNSSGKKDKSIHYFLDAYHLGMENEADFYTIDAAHMLGIVEKPADALNWNEIAIELIEKSTNERAKGWLGSLLNNTGWTYFDKGDFNTAMEYFKKNVAYHTERNHPAQLRIAKWCVARTLRAQNKIDEALKMQIELLESVGETEANDGYGFEELGELYLLKNDKENSKKYFKEAYALLSQDKWLAENEKERLERIKKLSE